MVAAHVGKLLFFMLNDCDIFIPAAGYDKLIRCSVLH